MIVNTQHVMKYGYQNKCMYGERIFQLSFYDAIYKEKILCEYQTYNIQFSYTGDDLTNFKLNVKQQ